MTRATTRVQGLSTHKVPRVESLSIWKKNCDWSRIMAWVITTLACALIFKAFLYIYRLTKSYKSYEIVWIKPIRVGLALLTHRPHFHDHEMKRELWESSDPYCKKIFKFSNVPLLPKMTSAYYLLTSFDLVLAFLSFIKVFSCLPAIM